MHFHDGKVISLVTPEWLSVSHFELFWNLIGAIPRGFRGMSPALDYNTHYLTSLTSHWTLSLLPYFMLLLAFEKNKSSHAKLYSISQSSRVWKYVNVEKHTCGTGICGWNICQILCIANETFRLRIRTWSEKEGFTCYWLVKAKQWLLQWFSSQTFLSNYGSWVEISNGLGIYLVPTQWQLRVISIQFGMFFCVFLLVSRNWGLFPTIAFSFCFRLD